MTKRRFIFLAILVLLVLAPEVGNAGLFDVIPSVADLVAGLFRVIIYIFGYIGGILFALAGMLTNFMLNLNLNVLNDSNSLVHVGWRIVRDIANLGFVLVIIVIAFATILRFEQYGVSKLLPKLIAAAIIVNFSFVIAAAFINFSHVITNFFAARAIPTNPDDLATALSSAFGPQRFLIDTDPLPPNPDEESGGSGFGTAILISITGLVFTVIFTFLGSLVMLAFAFMLLVRYLYLTFLVILAPLVWLFWVIPTLAGQFSKWWNSFLRWVFFAPASMFFVYLALVSISEIGEISAGGGVFTGSLQKIMTQGAQMVVLGGILIGGLIIAQKMSINFADNAVRAAKAGTFGLTKFMGRQGARVATLPLRTGRTPARLRLMRMRGAQTARTGTNVFQRMGGRIQSAFGVGLYRLSQAGRGANLFQSTIGEAVAGWKKKKRKLSPEEIAAGEV